MDFVINNPDLKNLYQNQGFSYNRPTKKTLVIASETLPPSGLTSNTTSNIHDLLEPLLIDKLSDVYLESFTTFGSMVNDTPDTCGFLISFDELDINSNGTARVYNKLFIPNECRASNSCTVHKSKKLNYICSISPTTISKITLKITDLKGQGAFIPKAGSRYILELLFIPRE